MPEVTERQTTTPASPPKQAPGGAKLRRQKQLRTALILVLILALAGGGIFALYRFLFNSGGELGEIYSAEAYIGSIEQRAAGSGTAKAKETAAITLTAGGTVSEVFVTAGDVVAAGQPLYTIDSQEAQEAVTEAGQKLDDLFQDMADLQEEAANLTVTAPFAGKLTEVQEFTVDQDVSSGAPVATLVNDKRLKLSLYYSYAFENSIFVGQSVSVSIPAVMRVLEGTVDRINKVSYVSPEGAVFFEVVISFPNPGTLTAGMSASASITAADGSEIFPYENGETQFYEVREIQAKAGGPVVGVGNLLNYANVSQGEPLLYLGSSDIDSRIRAKQEEIDQAQAALEEAQSALNNFNAVAPIDGTILTCTLTPGAEVKKDDTVIIISNTTTMLVTINVDDKNISFVKPGSYVDLDWNGVTYQGLVTSVDMGSAESGNGMTNYPVTLTVDNYDGSLMDGAWLQYSFVTSQSSDCVVVPSSAVKYVSDAQGNRQAVVFVQRDTPPEDIPDLSLPEPEPGMERTYPTQEEGYYPVIVETGLSNAESAEIKSGIEPGDVVFINYTVTEMGSSWG